MIDLTQIPAPRIIPRSEQFEANLIEVREEINAILIQEGVSDDNSAHTDVAFSVMLPGKASIDHLAPIPLEPEPEKP